MEPTVIHGINFKAVNEIYDTVKRKPKSQGTAKRATLTGSRLAPETTIDPFTGEEQVKKVDKRLMNELFSKKRVKEAELTD